MTKMMPMTDPEELEDYVDFKAAVAKLSEAEIRIISSLTVGYSLVQIASSLGISLADLKKKIVRIFISMNNTVPVVMWSDFLDAIHEAEFAEGGDSPPTQ